MHVKSSILCVGVLWGYWPRLINCSRLILAKARCCAKLKSKSFGFELIARDMIKQALTLALWGVALCRFLYYDIWSVLGEGLMGRQKE